MFLRSLLLAGAVALRASAVLVVPELDGDAATRLDEFMGILPLSSHTPYSQQVDLLCTECPFRETTEDGKVTWIDGAQTSLSLNFSVEDALLLANGRQIFPPPPSHVTAVQRRVDDGAESEPVSLGYALEVVPMAESADESGLELLSIRFTVLDLDGRPVPLDTVAIGLIHDGEGKFYIAKTDIEETAPKHVSWKQCSGKPNCLRKLLADRIRTLFAAAKSRVLGLASKMPGSKACHGTSAVPQPDGDSPVWTQGHLDHMHPGHADGHHRWERIISRIVRFVLIPATLGFLAGWAAGALGMLLAKLIVSLWTRNRRSNSQQTNPQLERGTESEKQSLMVVSADDLPPAYADHGSEEQMLEKH